MFSFKSTSSQGPWLFSLFTILIVQYRVANKADYHYLLLQSVSGIFDWSRKNLGLFMSLCIDLPLVRMNCRSMGLPPGRLNEQAQHRGLLLSATCFQLEENDDANDFQFPVLLTPAWVMLDAYCPVTKDHLRTFIFCLFLAFAKRTTGHYCDILSSIQHE